MAASLIPDDDSATARSSKAGEYVVVARRYRPQTFQELVGQGTVSQGLANAIQTNRVGHAYLFTGARGVGKTSSARIFAKSLNCMQGPTLTPCGQCDVCQGIASGEDVDVLEIDGASNRGIDEIRQLRSNVNIRPSRARFKIYIIDEVHMLTTAAFNALLKTLEEPPEHVKFIFCTTEADKIPITVLSRCQRFDFAPMELGSIMGRLEHIVKTEGIEVEPEALQIIARRAAGSMRDSQSLLEQLFSFGGEKITAADVHAMLGTAQGGRLLALTEKLIGRDASGALQELDRSISEGVDVGQLAEQLLGYFRDIAAATVGCGPDLLLHAPASDHAVLAELGNRLGLETLLAALQILDQSIVRMRQSTHIRTLVEMALVRICKLENLDQLDALVSQLRQLPAGSVGPRPAASSPVASGIATRPAAATTPGNSASMEPMRPSAVDPQKKNDPLNPAPAISPPATISDGPPLTLDEGRQAWDQAVATLAEAGDMTAGYAKLASDLAISGPQRLAVIFPGQYTYQKAACERPDRKARFEEAVSSAAGRKVMLEFRLGPPTEKTAVQEKVAPPSSTLQQKAQLRREKERHPFVQQAAELFGAEVEHVLEGTRREPGESTSGASDE